MTGVTRIVFGVLLLIAVSLAAWIMLYPSASDPKNPQYLLWKLGLWRMDLDTATGTMIGDGHHNKLVIGKSEIQLRNKFGYLLPPAEATDYLRSCYRTSPWRDKKVLFIRSSPWMIVFDGDVATNLVLVKGC
jgi:hypothetical protein